MLLLNADVHGRFTRSRTTPHNSQPPESRPHQLIIFKIILKTNTTAKTSKKKNMKVAA